MINENSSILDIFADNQRLADNFFAAADRFIAKQKKMLTDEQMDEMEAHFGAKATVTAEPEPFAELSAADQIIGATWLLLVLTFAFIF